MSIRTESKREIQGNGKEEREQENKDGEEEKTNEKVKREAVNVYGGRTSMIFF